MCNCINDIESKALESLKEGGKFKKPVKKVRIKEVIFPFTGDGLSIKTSNTLEIELDGQKKLKTMSMSHTYCPWCAEKY